MKDFTEGTKTAVFDNDLRIEAYRFKGIVQPFPSHFHEYYVIGLVEKGERLMVCKNMEYRIKKGCILLFNPSNPHACTQNDGGTLDYRGINIAPDVMSDLAFEITGKRDLPDFFKNVIFDKKAACCLRLLHGLVMEGACGVNKKESLLFLLKLLIQKYSEPFKSKTPKCPTEIEKACAFMDEHFAERINLEQICKIANLSKSALLRAFTKSKGMTPYSYLENIRIAKAKKLLEQGAYPLETALKTGFFDQSHFTNRFNRFLGLSPGVCREIFLRRNEL